METACLPWDSRFHRFHLFWHFLTFCLNFRFLSWFCGICCPRVGKQIPQIPQTFGLLSCFCGFCWATLGQQNPLKPLNFYTESTDTTYIYKSFLWLLLRQHLPSHFWFSHFEEWHFQKCHFQKKFLTDFLDELGNFKQKKIVHFWFLHFQKLHFRKCISRCPLPIDHSKFSSMM